MDFCARFPGECEVDLFEPARLTLTPETWATLVRVNEQTNRSVRPVTDIDHWGVRDRWDFPDDGRGDCEDIQLLKRKFLVEEGMPKRALRMTVVRDEVGDGHAVLLALTDRGDFVLDNKRKTVLPWNETGYTFVKREGSDDLAWVALLGGPGVMMTASAAR